jgi:hypothetical protein
MNVHDFYQYNNAHLPLRERKLGMAGFNLFSYGRTPVRDLEITGDLNGGFHFLPDGVFKFALRTLVRIKLKTWKYGEKCLFNMLKSYGNED